MLSLRCMLAWEVDLKVSYGWTTISKGHSPKWVMHINNEFPRFWSPFINQHMKGNYQELSICVQFPRRHAVSEPGIVYCGCVCQSVCLSVHCARNSIKTWTFAFVQVRGYLWEKESDRRSNRNVLALTNRLWSRWDLTNAGSFILCSLKPECVGVFFCYWGTLHVRILNDVCHHGYGANMHCFLHQLLARFLTHYP